ncbi:MAG: methyl-accepting chemotaxis protein, partial [Desulfovibrionales bacterium]|nr:methyl-accepting chemotaxis protein [Desulfovibrionales bacterium]
VQAIQANMEEMMGAVSKLGKDSQGLARGADHQTQAIQDIQATIKTIKTQADETAQTITQVNTHALAAMDQVDDCRDHMENLDQISNDVTRAGREIATTTGGITEIAEQTNLIALNAAIEAARAGDFGRGFNVVAQEVKQLAARSADAAQQTEILIHSTLEKMNHGNQASAQTRRALITITDHFKSTTDQVSAIAKAAEAQAKSTAVLSNGILEIRRVTRENSQISNQVTHQSQAMETVATHFKSACDRFSL